MPKANLLYVKILGTAINDRLQVLSHEIVALPAGTYHKFVLPDGTLFYLNDFGVRSLTIAKSEEALN